MIKNSTKYRFNPLFWYYVRKYKKLLLTDPFSTEVVEMAQRSGAITKLWKWQKTKPQRAERKT